MTLYPRQAVVDRLAAAGLELPLDCLLTPPAAVARWLQAQPPAPVAAFVTAPTRAELAGLPLLQDDARAGAKYVVIGDMGDAWNARELNRALALLLGGAELLALGMGRYWKAPDGLRLDCGAFVSALAYATGQTPKVFGKPAPEYFQMALDVLGLPAEQVAMVGDDVLSDVDAAQRLGMRGILVKTGKFQPADLDRGVTPAHVVPGIADVRQLIDLRGSEAAA
jgi:HAD superfamily hydrolase (TIGR01458 family)